MTAPDGNAIAGDLPGAFGAELTAATWAYAGLRYVVGHREAIVYMRGPGRVARCRGCSELRLVLVTICHVTCVDLRGINGSERENWSTSRK
jgi:hypothetical protein